MKHFFSVLFGGLLASFVGIFIAKGGVSAWQNMSEFLTRQGTVSFASVANVIGEDNAESISTKSQTVRYTASEEEDLIDLAAMTLPKNLGSEISARSYYMKNITSDTEINTRESDTLMPVASLTKLVTAVIARMYMDEDRRITISKDIMAQYGNTANFKVNETFILKDLLYPLLMVSSNESAEAIARTYGRKDFIGKMNDFAQSIGAYRTYFYDPSGISPKNLSTSKDMSIITEWIYNNDPTIIDITKEKTKTIRSHTWTNPTHFLSRSNYIGGKNGYTPEANRTATGLFTLGHSQDVYLVTILGSSSRDSDVLNLLQKASE